MNRDEFFWPVALDVVALRRNEKLLTIAFKSVGEYLKLATRIASAGVPWINSMTGYLDVDYIVRSSTATLTSSYTLLLLLLLATPE